MAAEDQLADPERPVLSLIESAGTASALTPSDTGQTSVPNAEQKKRQPGKQASPHPKEDDSAFAGETPEGVVVLHEALKRFKEELAELISQTETTPSWSKKFQNFFSRRSWRRFVSSSFYGMPLTESELVGEFANLLTVLEHPDNLVYAQPALFGLLALKSSRLRIAQSILEEIIFSTSTAAALTYVIRGVMRFVLMSVIILYLALSIVLALTVDAKIDYALIANHDGAKVMMAALFGCLGGVVSLLMRLSEFEMTRGKSRQFLLLSGATLPIVGGIFASVIASLLTSGIINFGERGAAGLSVYHYVVIGFLAGFSERFTRNLLNIAEGQFSRSTRRGSRESRGNTVTRSDSRSLLASRRAPPVERRSGKKV
jgi:hypothetical protein